MGVHLKEIYVQNLGPLSKFSMIPKEINVVFGRNEQGKTHLVEFLIRSLFRNLSPWKLREKSGTGKVIIQGLEAGETILSPSSAQKIEDFFEQEHGGLPPNFSRLLVVKGAELELAGKEQTVDKLILNQYLSGQGILEHIEGSISKTIQKAEIRNTHVIGNRQGELKEKETLKEELGKIKQLFAQIDKGYSGGKRKTLSQKRDSIKIALDVQDKAKRFTAFELHKKMRSLEDQMAVLSREKIQAFRDSLRMYIQKIEDYKKEKQEQQKAEKTSEHFEWLESACDLYQNALTEEGAGARHGFLIITVLALIGAGICVYLDQMWGALGALAGVLLFGLLYINSIQHAASQNLERQELAAIREEYKNRFHEDFTDFPAMKVKLNEMTEACNTAKYLKNQLISHLRAIEMQKVKLSELIDSIVNDKVPPENWKETLKSVEKMRHHFEMEYQEVRDRYHQLHIDPSDFCAEPQDMPYSEEEHRNLLNEYESIERSLQQENEKLDQLRGLICQVTNDDFTVSWDILIDNLRKRQEALLITYKDKTAEIIGKIIVCQVLKNIHEDEDVKIKEALASEHILGPLKQITQRYNRLELTDGQLLVHDLYNTFYFNDLSTGAQEQILMALRMGLCSRLFREDQLFLLLDDAFQYSDWNRREYLADTAIQLAESGWQIFYFTMDNHIRDLMKEKTKNMRDRFELKDLAA